MIKKRLRKVGVFCCEISVEVSFFFLGTSKLTLFFQFLSKILSLANSNHSTSTFS